MVAVVTSSSVNNSININTKLLKVKVKKFGGFYITLILNKLQTVWAEYLNKF